MAFSVLVTGATGLQGGAVARRQALALHAGGQVAVTEQVLAAADTVADPAPPAHDLGRQPGRIVVAGQVVSVAAVVAEHEIALGQQRAQRDGHVLLAETGVRGAVELAGREQIEQALLETPDEQQRVQVVVERRSRHGTLGT